VLVNRSIPLSTVIPVLVYPDVGEAVAWLCATFGFTPRIRIGNHRAQLAVGDGAVIVSEPRDDLRPPRPGEVSASVLVRIDDATRHHDLARERGARILQPLGDHPFGERQYTAEDLAGHRWTFSQSIADVAPEDWGGTPSSADT